MPKSESFVTKSLVRIKGKPSILRLIDQFSNIRNNSMHVVVGHKANKIIEILPKNIVSIINNRNYKNDTNLGSLYLAIKKIKEKSSFLDGVLIVEADSFIRTEEINHFSDFLEKNGRSFKSPTVIWTATGNAKSNQSGGFLEVDNLINQYGVVKRLLIQKKCPANLYKYKKLYGISWVNNLGVLSWLNYVEKKMDLYLKLKKLPYYHEPYIENRKLMDMNYFDIYDQSLSFNDYSELLEIFSRD